MRGIPLARGFSKRDRIVFSLARAGCPLFSLLPKPPRALLSCHYRFVRSPFHSIPLNNRLHFRSSLRFRRNLLREGMTFRLVLTPFIYLQSVSKVTSAWILRATFTGYSFFSSKPIDERICVSIPKARSNSSRQIGRPSSIHIASTTNQQIPEHFLLRNLTILPPRK